MPSDTVRQQISALKLEISDSPPYSITSDHFHNRKFYGHLEAPHTTFEIKVSGSARTGLDIFEEYTSDPFQYSLFKAQTPLTQPGSALAAYHSSLGLGKLGSVYEKVLHIMHRLHGDFEYIPGLTEVHESAESAFSLGKGVCQDYAQIMISLLRAEGIPARYVVGMMQGEGCSHAWVEALCNGYWYGFDPTNDKLVGDEYIRASCGRDSNDCSIIRGFFYGIAAQTQSEKVMVEEEIERTRNSK